jgi:hypothetical protein
MDDSVRFGLELLLAIAIWIVGHRLWMLRFTKQWFADMLKEEKELERLFRISRQGEPARKFVRDLTQASGEPSQEVAVQVEIAWDGIAVKWDRESQLLFGALVLLLLGTAVLSVTAFLVNLLIPLIASRFIGRFNSAYIKAGSALLTVIDLLGLWYEDDSLSCEAWCTVSHPELAHTFHFMHSMPAQLGVEVRGV